MGTKGQWREANVFVFEKLRRGEHGVARATILTRGDGEKQRGRLGWNGGGTSEKESAKLESGRQESRGRPGFLSPKMGKEERAMRYGNSRISSQT